MKVFTQKLKFVIPLLILVLGISFLFLFEFYIKDRVNTKAVIVASRDIPFKKQITKDDLTVKLINKDYLIKDTFRPDQMEYLIGTYASIEIKAGTQMYPALVDEYDLVPNESKGEFIAPIPEEWLFAVPGTLKRSYIADIYVVGNDEQLIMERLIRDSQEYSENNSKNVPEEENTSEATQNNDRRSYTSNKTDSYIRAKYKPILKNVRIAHVRDGSNQEITKNPESNDPYSATSTISTIEIIATDESLSTIRQYVDRGYKLYITYDYERSENDEMESEKGVDKK